MTHWTLEHPDAVMVTTGSIAGTGLGAAAGGAVGAIIGFTTGGLLTLALANRAAPMP